MEIGKIEQLTQNAIDAIMERKPKREMSDDVRRLAVSLWRMLQREYPEDCQRILRELVVK